MNKEKFSTYIKKLHSILNEYFDNEDNLFDVYGTSLPENHLHPLYALSYCCRMTSRSCIILLNHSNNFDASILMRSIIHGTVKFIFLLKGSGDDRVEEYTKLLPKKQFASNEQVQRRCLNSGFYGSGKKADFMKRHVVDFIDAHKTLPTQSSDIRRVSNRWNYLNLSNEVAKECCAWADLQVRMDAKYSGINDYVHWNVTGCYEVMSALASGLQDDLKRIFYEYCIPLDILLDLCSLACVRCEVFSERVNLPRTTLDDFIRKNRDFLKEIGDLREKYSCMIMEEFNE
jgi:hypothetical protein